MAQVTKVPKINFHIDCPVAKEAEGLVRNAVTHAWMRKGVYIYEELDGEQVIMTRDGIWFGDENPNSYFDHPRRRPAYNEWQYVRESIPDNFTWVGWTTVQPRTIHYKRTFSIMLHLILDRMDIVPVGAMGKIVDGVLPIIPMIESKSLILSDVAKEAAKKGLYGANPHVRGIVVREGTSFHRNGWPSSIFRYALRDFDKPPTGWFNQKYKPKYATVSA